MINHLTEIIDSGRVSHAQLLLGPSSSGSLALAIAYAQYLNCENRQHYHGESDLRADSCGECPTCKKYQQLMHTDLHFVFPTATTSSASSSPCSNEFIEQFREFLNNYHQTGTEDQWYEHLGIEKKQGMIRERDVEQALIREIRKQGGLCTGISQNVGRAYRPNSDTDGGGKPRQDALNHPFASTADSGSGTGNRGIR